GSRLEHEKDLAEADFEVIEALEAYAKDHGHELLTLAISWLASQQVTASVIAGGSKPEQMAANAAAAQWKMTETQLSEIDQIVSKE
ncbi:MAG: aldo/keto reductase, partial [Pseudomonadota bacterium]|nr:aldo/keto reductase [Pseudomonadota bacterium]